MFLFRYRFLLRKVFVQWQSFVIARRPRVLTEEEEIQIKFLSSWRNQVFSTIEFEYEKLASRLKRESREKDQEVLTACLTIFPRKKRREPRSLMRRKMILLDSWLTKQRRRLNT